MNIDTLRKMLAWSTLINWLILLLWFVFFAFAHDQMHRMHQMWFSISAENFDLAHYLLIGGYKLMIIIFNLVPYLALRIIGKRKNGV